MNGRALFSFNPDLFQDNEGALEELPEEEEEKVDEGLFANEAGAEEEVDFE